MSYGNDYQGGYSSGEYYGSGGYYSSGGYAGFGGYHDAPPPGGSLDAASELQGPGTSAYLHSGYDTSYASESATGGVFEQNTTYSYQYLTQETSYTASSSYSYYSTHSYYSSAGIYSSITTESYTYGGYTYGDVAISRDYMGDVSYNSYHFGNYYGSSS